MARLAHGYTNLTRRLLLDWESAHLGQPLEDLAWAEWIVRMHHADHLEALASLFAASGIRVPWSDRHACMVRQCRDILGYCESAGMMASAEDWRGRLRRTEEWHTASCS